MAKDVLAKERTRMALAEKAVADLEREAQRREEQLDRLIQLRDREEGYQDLAACFGPRGVRQILLDEAAPEVEGIANDLLEVASEGRFRFRISTQKVLKGGDLAEDFGIWVRDEHGERDVLRYSGGQLQMFLIVLRIAVALWVARLEGRPAETLILDEAADRLGADGTDALLRLLEHLGDRIKTIVLITHDPSVADRFPTQIRVQAGRIIA